ncbi:MAG: transcription-repair coupling factor, partial [Candidatus Competibacteraceae bacterium]|nr:transcription-repair coupling factor [Candidatus Competibacteraceae bacterium]
YRLPQRRQGILVVPAATLVQRLSPRAYLDGHALLLEKGQELDLDDFRSRLEAAGYSYVSQVTEHGEFTVRGSLVDLFPMGAELPYRIDLLDEDVDTIRTFDTDSQRSIDKVERVELLPAREFSLTRESITRFRHSYRARFAGDPQQSLIYREVSAGHAPGGIEYYLPLFFEATATLFDYLPQQTLVIQWPGVHKAVEDFWQQVQDRFEQRRVDPQRPLLEPRELFLGADEVAGRLKDRPRVKIAQGDGQGIDYATRPLPDLTLAPRAEQPAARLSRFLADFPGKVLLAAESAGRREVLLETLDRYGLRPRPLAGWQAFLDGEQDFAITVAPLEQGLLLEQPPLAVIAEGQLYAERVSQPRRRSAAARDTETVIRNLTDLALGAPVVHEDHGVGRYRGLERLAAAGMDAEFVVLEYAEGGKLYVPVAALHLLSRYTGSQSAPLHKLGSEQWVKAKRKAQERVRDAAAELLDIYARRQARTGHTFTLTAADYQAFAAAFPFEETHDQRTAIEAVLADMRSPRPMDRLVCGDVGFGKTEVAMRAAFVAVQDGKQVAVLVPTTLLAQQHYQNFQDRFADWPVKVEVLSRFRSKKQVEGVLEQVAAGRVDILIGTHKLLQGNMNFKRLGLAIIDEEHRFGVRHKERLKQLRAEVDVLTLTATPIPRTLNMSLAGMRDLSIIATPPVGRLAVKTFVGQWDKTLIREAVLRELTRGGQVYFLHNEVDTINRMIREVEEMVPEARVALAHGQMRERELEQVMLDFYHQRCNLLVCTTIVESGIDVPTANTIIINRADKLGL